MKQMSAESTSEDFCIHFKDTWLDTDNTLEHYHDSYEIALFIKANVQIFVKDIKYDITDGDMMYINEYDIHKVIYSSNSHYSRYVINFRGDYIKSLLKSLQIECIFDMFENQHIKKVNLNINQRNEMEFLFHMLTKTYNSSRGTSSGVLQASVKSTLVTILVNFNEILSRLSPAKIINKKENQVKKLVKFIDSTFMNSITLELLSEKYYMSKFYISRIFKEITGFSVMDYLQHRRIIEAQKMLRDSQKEIIDICFDCGFNNIQHFYLVFKKISKTTPYKYRNNM